METRGCLLVCPFHTSLQLLNLLIESPLQLSVPTQWRPLHYPLPAAHTTAPEVTAPPASPGVVLSLLAFTQALGSLETCHVPCCSPLQGQGYQAKLEGLQGCSSPSSITHCPADSLEGSTGGCWPQPGHGSPASLQGTAEERAAPQTKGDWDEGR